MRFVALVVIHPFNGENKEKFNFYFLFEDE